MEDILNDLDEFGKKLAAERKANADRIKFLEAEVTRLNTLLRTNFMDDHLRIELHFKEHHIRKLVKPDQHIDFTHVIGVIVRDMWEDLKHVLVRSGVIK